MARPRLSAPLQPPRVLSTLPFVLVILIILILLSNHSTAATGNVYYPPFFNVALMKPVSVEPASSVCGQAGITDYCGSMVDQQSTLSCGVETCDMSCPYRNSLPTGERISAFQRVSPGYVWGDCVEEDTTILAPFALAENSKHFLGTSTSGSDPCYIDLDPNWMAPLNLMGGSWTATLGVWLYHVNHPGKS